MSERFHEEDEAIALANNTPYGLAGVCVCVCARVCVCGRVCVWARVCVQRPTDHVSPKWLWCAVIPV